MDIFNNLAPHDAAVTIGLAFTVPVVASMIGRFLIKVVVACRR